MVLNGDSTHPRPWRVPSDWERVSGLHSQFRIYTPENNGNFTPRENWVTNTPFVGTLFTAFKKGAVLGVTLGLTDVLVFSRIKNPAAQFARVLFVAVPTAVAPVAWLSARRLLDKVDGEIKYFSWFAAGFAPGTIYGLFHNRISSGVYCSLIIGLFGVIYMESRRLGFDPFIDITESRAMQREQSFWPNAWKEEHHLPQWSKKDVPSWKKWDTSDD